jgi:hypothetical protein
VACRHHQIRAEALKRLSRRQRSAYQGDAGPRTQPWTSIKRALPVAAPLLPPALAALQEFKNLVVYGADGRGQMFVGRLGTAVADDDIAIGEGIGIRIAHRGGADRRLLSGVKQTSHFKGVRTVFG